MSNKDFGSIAWWCLQCCYTAAGFGMIAYSAANYQAAANFEFKAVSTVGEITRTIAKTTYSYSTYSAIPHTYYVSTIQFNTSQGKTITLTTRNACDVNDKPYACDGKQIQVFYDPDDPQLAMIKGGSSPLDEVMTTFWYGLFFVGVGSVSVLESASSSTLNHKQWR